MVQSGWNPEEGTEDPESEGAVGCPAGLPDPQMASRLEAIDVVIPHHALFLVGRVRWFLGGFRRSRPHRRRRHRRSRPYRPQTNGEVDRRIQTLSEESLHLEFVNSGQDREETLTRPPAWYPRNHLTAPRAGSRPVPVRLTSTRRKCRQVREADVWFMPRLAPGEPHDPAI